MRAADAIMVHDVVIALENNAKVRCSPRQFQQFTSQQSNAHGGQEEMCHGCFVLNGDKTEDEKMCCVGDFSCDTPIILAY